MTKQKNTARRVFEIIMTLLTALVGVLFIVQVWRLYGAGGEDPYTTESIASHFSLVSIPFFGWLILSVAGTFAFKEETYIPKAYVDVKTTLKRLESRLQGGQNIPERNQYATIRKGVCIASGLIMTGVCILSLVYLLDSGYKPQFSPEFFQTHAEAEILLKVSVFSILALVFCSVAADVAERMQKKELAIVKKQLAENAKQGIKPQTAVKKERKTLSQKQLFYVRVALCAIGVVLFIVGIFNGGMMDVYEKAKNICTQCIGLG